jgi:hypothetical protein
MKERNPHNQNNLPVLSKTTERMINCIGIKITLTDIMMMNITIHRELTGFTTILLTDHITTGMPTITIRGIPTLTIPSFMILGYSDQVFQFG